MKKISNKISHTFRILCLILLILLIALPAYAQTTNDRSAGNKGDKKDKSPAIRLNAELGLEYNDNVFRLTDAQISIMESNDPRDISSDRFKDMDSISDYIIEPRMGLRYDSSSPFGGKFWLTSWIRYNYYTKNDKSGFPEARIRLNNSVGKNGTLSLEVNLLYGFFKKNYLSGINDTNGNNNITREERTYSPATYDEYEGIIAYEHRIINDKERRISGLDIRPFAGYLYRKYNSGFGNRDQDITIAGVGLDLEFISRIDLRMIYQYEKVCSPNNTEIVLFNENDTGIDIDDDLTTRNNAPLITNIDRSSNRHTIEINPSIRLTKDASFYIGYRKRITTYSSDNPLDIERYNKKAHRQQIRSGITYSFSKEWSADVEYSKTDDDDDEDGEYSRNNYLLTIRYDFK